MKKKSIYMVVLVWICMSVLIPHTDVSAAKKIALNKTSVSMQKGKTRTLKLKGAKKKNVKWSSNNKKIATVKKGVVKAKKVGNCVVTAKYKGKKYKCKIKVTKKKIPVIKVTEPENTGEVTMTAQLSETCESLKLVISNTTNKDYGMGMEFTLKHYEDGRWTVVETDVPVTAIAQIIPAGGTGNQIIVLGDFYESLKKGQYRVTKIISKDEGLTLTAEFTLGSDMIYSE